MSNRLCIIIPAVFCCVAANAETFDEYLMKDDLWRKIATCESRAHDFKKVSGQCDYEGGFDEMGIYDNCLAMTFEPEFAEVCTRLRAQVLAEQHRRYVEMLEGRDENSLRKRAEDMKLLGIKEPKE